MEKKVYYYEVNITEVIKNLLFPKVCLGCGKIGAYFCRSCLKLLPKILRQDTICPVCTKPAVSGVTHPRCQTKYSPDGLVTIFQYDGMIRKAIKLLKYQRVKDLVPEVATAIIENLTNVVIVRMVVAERPLVIPVPLHKDREKGRWFNQSELLANSIAKKLQLEFQSDLLVRTKFSKPQAGLLKADRLKNIKDSFKSNPDSSVPNSIILFDDVWTTGATMRECVNVLKRGGVKKIWCLTVAR